MSFQPLQIGDQPLRGTFIIGVVVDNNDPLKDERIRVRVREIHREIENADIPWAVPVGRGGPQGNNGAIGGVHVPALGSKVWVSFVEDNLYFPIYLGSASTNDAIPAELTDEDYPNVYGQIDNYGNLFYVNTATGEMRVHHADGTIITITPDEMKVVAAGPLKIMANDELQIISSSKVNVSAPRIDHNTDSLSPDAVTARSRPAAATIPDKDY
jgi:hypothetical protein